MLPQTMLVPAFTSPWTLPATTLVPAFTDPATSPQTTLTSEVRLASGPSHFTSVMPLKPSATTLPLMVTLPFTELIETESPSTSYLCPLIVTEAELDMLDEYTEWGLVYSSSMPLSKYLFAEIATNRQAYRLIEAVDYSEEDARVRIKYTLGIAYLLVLPTKQTKPGIKTRLFREREKWKTFLARHSLTATQVDRLIHQATVLVGTDISLRARRY